MQYGAVPASAGAVPQENQHMTRSCVVTFVVTGVFALGATIGIILFFALGFYSYFYLVICIIVLLATLSTMIRTYRRWKNIPYVNESRSYVVRPTSFVANPAPAPATGTVIIPAQAYPPPPSSAVMNPPPPTAPVQQSSATTPLTADYPPAYAEASAPPYPSSQDPAVDPYQNVANETMGIYNV